MRSEVHQFLPSFGHRDAVGNHTLETQRALRAGGIGGGIWAAEVFPENRGKGGLFVDYPSTKSARRGKNALLYQASTGSGDMVEFLLRRPEPLAVYYHNITPDCFYAPFDTAAAAAMQRGRLELPPLCEKARAFLANSEYSAKELRELTDLEVRVVPPYLPPGLGVEVDASHAAWLRKTKRGTDLLFVGRLAPNKNHADLLRVFAAYRAAVDPGARLFVAGAWGPRPYVELVMRLRDKLGADGIVFTGSISDARLAAHYREADAFVSTSLHEGFGLPLIEAMRASLPVIAYEGGAVEETLGGAGVLVRTLDPPLVAEVIGRVTTDEGLREQIVDRQLARVAELDAIPRDEILLDALRAVLPR